MTSYHPCDPYHVMFDRIEECLSNIESHASGDPDVKKYVNADSLSSEVMFCRDFLMSLEQRICAAKETAYAESCIGKSISTTKARTLIMVSRWPT